MHIALICPAVPGHLNPMTTLGRALWRRGHTTTLIALPDAETKTRANGLGFEPFGVGEFPVGTMAKTIAELGALDGAAALRHTLDHYARETSALLRDVPAILRRIGADGVLIDQTQPGITAAELAGIPCVTVCCALALNPEPMIPPWSTNWPYDPTPEGRARNEARSAITKQILQPLRDLVNDFRRGKGLADTACPAVGERDGDSELATISQQPALFDFPREFLPSTFHYTGPFHDSGFSTSPTEPLPFANRLDGRPIIYASMGTLQNNQELVFQTIAEACAPLDAQLILSLGRRDAAVDGFAAQLPGSPIVLPYAPQVELLKQTALMITHAGLNTVLEALSQGVPMVALPITNDQPGVAARLKYIGAGDFVPLGELSPERLREAVERVLREQVYRDAAKKAQAEIGRINGVERAAEIAELAIGTGNAVFRD